jgi:hypothetical protein
MITSFMAANELHAVHMIAQKGMTQIRAISFCKVEGDAGAGVYQVADWGFDGRAKYGEIPVCPKCSSMVVSLKKEPPK